MYCNRKIRLLQYRWMRSNARGTKAVLPRYLVKKVYEHTFVLKYLEKFKVIYVVLSEILIIIKW